MIPKHECVKHPLYCNEETGVHCWWDGVTSPWSAIQIPEVLKEEGIDVIRWQPESDVGRLFYGPDDSDYNGTPINEDNYPYGVLIWGKELP